MEKVIKSMNVIHSCVEGTELQYHLSLPQIAVVGSQSAGKSSVLESIVGIDFLPRGIDIVTRCPLRLTLVHKECEIYAVFGHYPDKKYFDFSEVKDEIINKTDELCDDQIKVVSTAIELTVYSPTVPDLTLIDLPGLTKVPMEGQPESIVQDIHDLVYSYITPPNTIILAVIPANDDPANSAGLSAAREVDPEGNRTIGVLTKIDIMDAGTNARKYLCGDSYPLKLGYIGVKCRNHEENTKGKTIKQALKDENDYFKENPNYKDICAGQGIEYLSKKLSTILHIHILSKLPEIEDGLIVLKTKYKKI